MNTFDQSNLMIFTYIYIYMDFKFLKTPYHIFQIYICIYGFKIFLYLFDFDVFLALNCIVQIIAEETGASLL